MRTITIGKEVHMSALSIILLSLIAGAGGLLSGYIFLSKTQGTDEEAKKERMTAILLSGAIALLVGVSIFLVNGILSEPKLQLVMGLLIVIVFSGALGGSIGFYYRKICAKKNDKSTSVIVSIVMGIGAAMLVPVLLHILTSNLLADIQNFPEKAFILSGLCIAAAISSEVFIEQIVCQVDRMGKKPSE